MLSDFSTIQLCELHNKTLYVVSIGKPHQKAHNEKLITEIKLELIKRNLVSQYVLDYKDKL
jgi:hypothetical protein